MCSSFKNQKSIRFNDELCDAVQAYALANRIALRPRWFSNFVNTAVREKLLREGFLSVGSEINECSARQGCSIVNSAGSVVSGVSSSRENLVGCGLSCGGGVDCRPGNK